MSQPQKTDGMVGSRVPSDFIRETDLTRTWSCVSVVHWRVVRETFVPREDASKYTVAVAPSNLTNCSFRRFHHRPSHGGSRFREPLPVRRSAPCIRTGRGSTGGD